MRDCHAKKACANRLSQNGNSCAHIHSDHVCSEVRNMKVATILLVSFLLPSATGGFARRTGFFQLRNVLMGKTKKSGRTLIER